MSAPVLLIAVLMLLISIPGRALAGSDLTVTIRQLTPSGSGESIGTIRFQDSPDGLRIQPRLDSLPAGPHGLHVHSNPDCGPGMKDGQPVAGLAAGGHFDPAETGLHAGPLGKGHLGDLPRLVVDADGQAGEELLAPRLTVADLSGRSVMVHAGGDNYSDEPSPLGGGGARLACGVIPPPDDSPAARGPRD